ncbi:MAG: argininosuccinate lyase [Bacillaceae bacterium]
MSKLWGGRFTKQTNELVDYYTSSIGFDHLLWKEDIKGSLAHVNMLQQQGILSKEETTLIEQGLHSVYKKIEQGELVFSVEDEDIHMNIEKALIEEIGEVGGKLHTGRSRNDQVATDMHLYVREQTKEIIHLIESCQQALVNKASENVETILPGYTHLQRAQPISFAHHLLTYFWMLERDKGRFEDSLKRVNISPLGAGALAGTTFPIDRYYSAQLMEFEDVYPNSLDAVSNRDFIVELLSNSSMLMMHLSRFAEELVQWSSKEFDFIELDDAFCTGSSMMPQKKNPDVPELIRGKSGRVFGNLFGLLTVLKGLPLAYNKDLQEDKEGMFDTVQTVTMTLEIVAPLIETMTVKKDHMYEAVTEDYSNATDVADYLAAKGVPFRQAHEITGRLVLYAIRKKCYLQQLTIKEYKDFSAFFDMDIYDVLKPENVVNARNSEGATGMEQVTKQLAYAKSKLEKAVK